MNDTIEETAEEQQERAAMEALQVLQARKALGQAAELAQHIRSLTAPSDGHTESGEEFRVMRTPLLTTETDDADELYARLLEWVANWAEYLGAMPPATAVVAYRGRDEVLGFPASTTPSGAWALMQLQTTWLLLHDEQITENNPEAAAVYRDDVAGMIWGLRAKYKLTPVREKAVQPGPCPVCGERAIEAVWLSSNVLDVKISCTFCGHVVPAPRASQIVRWVQQEAVSANGKSEACELLEHGSCAGVNCSCSCHLEHDAPAVGHGQQTPVTSDPGRVPRLPASTELQDPRTCPVCHLIHPEGACQEASDSSSTGSEL